MSFDHDQISSILIECAEKYVLPRYKLLQKHEIHTKSGPNDLVTQADMDVEDHLDRVLPGLLPNSIVVGEEAVSSGRTSLDIMKNDGPLWIVDPVDGTHNFVHGRREFGIMLALVDKGETQAGWIYDVLGNEMTVAQRGQGAYTAGKRLQVAKEKTLAECEGYLSPLFFPKQFRAHLVESSKKVKSCNALRCAAHEYLHIAKGEADFAFFTGMKPWDHLAGCLIVEEAGGYVATWDGERYTPRNHGKGLIAASSRDTWANIFNHFIKKII